jgi:hypothetical protein
MLQIRQRWLSDSQLSRSGRPWVGAGERMESGEMGATLSSFPGGCLRL